VSAIAAFLCKNYVADTSLRVSGQLPPGIMHFTHHKEVTKFSSNGSQTFWPVKHF